jgi:predicted enzyme related to lactoylglutathione lyase
VSDAIVTVLLRDRQINTSNRLETMQLAPLICVEDVPAASQWYQDLLGCTSGHGGAHYERLNSGDRLVLQLHKWDVEHHHGPLGDPSLPIGNGVILWFELDDFDAAYERAKGMRVAVLKDRLWSENGNWELWIRDPNGYAVVLTSPLP